MINLKNKINKAATFRELKKIAENRYEQSWQPELQEDAFIGGAEALLKLLRIGDVVGQSEQLNAFKNDETVVLDGTLEVKIINIESKVLVKVIEDDTLMWVKKDRLKREYSL